LADRRNKDKIALDILVVTSNNDLQALKGALKDKGVTDQPVVGVRFAGTPYHGSKVYMLGGVIGPNGKGLRKDLVSASDDVFGSWPISREGITDTDATTAWFYAANGEYRALASIQKLSKRKGESGEQAKLVLQRVGEYFTSRRDGITLPLTTIADYDAAESLLEDLGHAKLRDFRDMERELKTALRAATKEASLADELTARKAYLTCLEMQISGKSKELDQAKAGFEQISDRYGSTAYGKRAAKRLEHMKLAMHSR
jgi:hypothetical protein